MVEGIRAGRGQFDAFTKEGTRVAVSIAPIPGTQWHVAVGQPVAELVLQARLSMLLILCAGVVCAGVSIGASQFLARAIAQQFSAVAMAHARGSNAETAPSAIREVTELGKALHDTRSKVVLATEALRAARHDALTALPARGLFMERAQQHAADAPAQGWCVALLFIDLDGFKQVNDWLGHDEGDRVLKSVAEVIRGCVRPDDVVGRLGGDEFVVCIRGPENQVHEISEGVAHRIVEGVRGIGNGIGCSIGTAFARESGDLETLIEQADRAMLTAKRSGKNRVTIAA